MASDDDNKPLTLKRLMDSAKEGARTAQKARTGLSFLARLVFNLLLLAVCMPASMATPLLRKRMGMVVLLHHGWMGLVLIGLLMSSGTVRGWSGLVPLAWWLALWLTLLGRCAGCVRRFFDRGAEPVHSRDLGRPIAPLAWLWARLLGDAARDGIRVAAFCEAPLLLAIAVALAGLEAMLYGRTPAPSYGAWVIPALAGLGVAGQAGVIVAREAWKLQRLRDQEIEQRELSLALSASGHHDRREVEGFARIPW